jgi:hypothetical protein
MELIDRAKIFSNGVFIVDHADPEKSLNELLTLIANAPTIDAVPVVRCKDCKYFISGICRSDFGLNYSCGDDFCSHGERKDNGTD